MVMNRQIIQNVLNTVEVMEHLFIDTARDDDRAQVSMMDTPARTAIRNSISRRMLYNVFYLTLACGLRYIFVNYNQISEAADSIKF